MTKSRFYKTACLILVLLNVILISFLIIGNRSPRDKGRSPGKKIKEQIIQTLNLNEEQLIQFNALADQHEAEIRLINQQQQRLLRPYFGSISDSTIVSNEELILNQFEKFDREKLSLTYSHFNEIKNILNKDQLVDFQSLMDGIIDRIIRLKKNKRSKTEGLIIFFCLKGN